MGAIDPITDVSSDTERLETMEETGGNVQMAKIFVVQQKYLSLTEGRRVSSDIDQHIVYSAVRAPHQLGLAPSGAPVHAANDALRRAGLGILNEGRRDPGFPEMVVEDLGVERPREQSAVVTKRFRDEDQHVGEVCSFDTHMEMLS